MGNYNIAYPKTAGNEGGFANVAGDNGGVTYCGITYKNYPNWVGWPTVFAANLKHGDVIPSLASAVKQFYKNEFWDKVRGDEIKDQEMAEQLFDMAVNASIGAAAKIAHETVGLEGVRFTDLLINKINGTVALLLLLFTVLTGCRFSVGGEYMKPKHDTVYLPTRIVCDTVYMPVVVTDTLFMGNCDSMAMRLRAATFRLNRIKYYVNICNRNPKQDKFLKGWVNRGLK